MTYKRLRNHINTSLITIRKGWKNSRTYDSCIAYPKNTMKTSLSSGSDGSPAVRPSNRAMVPVLIGIALIMLVSKTAGLLAVAVVCYMIIGLETAVDSPRSENVMRESLDSGLDPDEVSRSKLEVHKQKSVRPSKTNPVGVNWRSSLL